MADKPKKPWWASRRGRFLAIFAGGMVVLLSVPIGLNQWRRAREDAKIKKWAEGVREDDPFAMAALVGDVVDVISDFTQTLAGITDAASANAALPKLKTASSRLDSLKGLWVQVPDAEKPGIKTELGTRISNADQLLEKVAAVPGLGDVLRPVANEVLDKLKTF
jgi:hypothetical protein